MIKHLLAAAVAASLSFASHAKTETIKIYSPYSPGHSGTPALLKIVDEANSSQDVYKFLVEFKPGGNQIIAVKSLQKKYKSALEKSQGDTK